ncbi:MAG: hypothetical protein KKA28_06685 [Planctomycetes bacterium]|nr:hypothetical protein [Planctomycetota bacterium]MCG2682590.1 hypothetical protein [Planctomycetales bacterium]
MTTAAVKSLESSGPCPECGGYLIIYKNRLIPGTPWARRYLKCDKCGLNDAEIAVAGPPRRKKVCTNMVSSPVDAKRKHGKRMSL